MSELKTAWNTIIHALRSNKCNTYSHLMIMTSRSIGNPLVGRCPTCRWLLGLSILYLLYTTNLLISSSFHHHQQHIHCPSVHLSSDPSSRPPPPPIALSSSAAAAATTPPTGLQHIVFGIMALVRLWEKQREYIKVWWRLGQMQGYVWLDKPVAEPNASSALPAIKISADHQQHIHFLMERAAVRRTKRKRRRRAGRGCRARPGGLGVGDGEEDEEEEEGEEGGSGQPLGLGEGVDGSAGKLGDRRRLQRKRKGRRARAWWERGVAYKPQRR